MGLVAGSLLSLQGRLGLAGWQWLFLVEGLPAALIGVVILLFLPDSPKAANWLAPDEKAWIESALAADLTSGARQADRGILRALLNPLVLGFTIVNMISLGSYYAFNLSAPQILGEATHLGAANTGFVISAGGLLGAFAMILAGWHSDYRKERFLHLAFPLLTSAVAYGIIGIASDPTVVIAAYWLAVASNAGIAATFWLAPGDVLAPRSMAVCLAAINSVGQLGSFISPFLWGIAKDRTGNFHFGISMLPVSFVLAMFLILWLRRQAQPRIATFQNTL
jgi:ACS family tartrate transporter-like MFS transporter